METDPQTISAYLVYLSQHTPVEEQGQHSDLALVRGWGGALHLEVVGVGGGTATWAGVGDGGRCRSPACFPGLFCPEQVSRV